MAEESVQAGMYRDSGYYLSDQPCYQVYSDNPGNIELRILGYNGTFVAQAYVERSPETLARAIQFVINSNLGIFGTLGLFLAWFIILAAGMTGIWNPTVGVILINIAVIFVNLIGLATFSPLVIFGLLGSPLLQ